MSDASTYVDAAGMDWQEAPGEGVFVKKLFRDKESGSSALIIKLEQGAVYHAHQHTGDEHYYVLEGALEERGKSIPSGGYVHHRAGSAHRPYTKNGCVVFVTLGKPVLPACEEDCQKLFG